MFTDFTVALIASLGLGAWAYSKALKANGGLTQRALIVGAVAGVIAFIVVFTLLKIIFSRFS